MQKEKKTGFNKPGSTINEPMEVVNYILAISHHKQQKKSLNKRLKDTLYNHGNNQTGTPFLYFQVANHSQTLHSI